MDPALVAASAALAVALLVALLLLRQGGGRASATLTELAIRLDQLAKMQAASQAEMADRLHAQERALSKAVEERLAELGQRVGDRLQEQGQEASKSLGELKERLAVIDAAQRNITELSTQVVGLQDILANKQARGRFGEILLENLLRDALPPGAYELQATVGRGRCDCLIRLPYPPGPIAIDAKFPREGYEALREARDEAAQVQARRAFSTAIRAHVQDIAGKYIVDGETAESALMFVPSEAIYAELHASFPNLVEESHRQRVWIVSPTTLMATLTTLRAVLRDVEMRKQAGLIQKEVRRLLEDVVRLDGRTANLEKHFNKAVEDVRQIRISAGEITRHGERIGEVRLEDGTAGESLPQLAPATKN